MGHILGHRATLAFEGEPAHLSRSVLRAPSEFLKLPFAAMPKLSAPDLGDGAAQFGGERAEPVSAALAIPGLADLLQSVGGGTETNSADCLRRTFEPVRGSCQAGEVSGAPRCVYRLLRIGGAVAELPQQFLDAGAIAAARSVVARSTAANSTRLPSTSSPPRARISESFEPSIS